MASKGPLSLAGNVELEGVNVSVESNVYIESENSILALSITDNSHIAGDVSIANSIANVYLQGANAGIGGETDQDAIDNHVSFGVPEQAMYLPDSCRSSHCDMIPLLIRKLRCSPHFQLSYFAFVLNISYTLIGT